MLGALGIGTFDGGGPEPRSPVGLADVEQIACGASSCCAASAGEVYCWGDNMSGLLGIGITPPRASTPMRVIH